MKTKEQEVEELEERFNIFRNSKINSLSNGIAKLHEIEKIKQKAKLLKEDIEKGCRDYVFENAINPFGQEDTIRCGTFWAGRTHLCPKCQNLNERLNKIIGDKE